MQTFESIFHGISPIVIYQTKLDHIEIIKEAFLNNFDKYGFDPKLYPMVDYLGDSNPTFANAGDLIGGLKGFIHQDECFSPLFSQLKIHLDKFLNGLSINAEKLSYHITKSWYTIVDGGANINEHYHNAADLSFVYYVRVPSEHGNIHFLNPSLRQNSLNCYFQGMLDDFPYERNLVKNTDNLHIQKYLSFPSFDGDLIIFPAALPHMVPPYENPTHEDRYSISGDIKLCLAKDVDNYALGLVHPSRWKEL